MTDGLPFRSVSIVRTQNSSRYPNQSRLSAPDRLLRRFARSVLDRTAEKFRSPMLIMPL